MIGLDGKNNNVIVGGRNDLLVKGLTVRDVNMFVDKLPDQFLCKIRYNSKPISARANIVGNALEIVFNSLAEAVTPGQSVVFYDNDIVLGGGIIDTAIR